eukprot:GHVS01038311.1.p1 GENE.GHVS01038311.1~~GHVS01038311.1.p1  ORF type:complete len:555 (+),score=132.32 GHVS01038311.1:465-2129(+)
MASVSASEDAMVDRVGGFGLFQKLYVVLLMGVAASAGGAQTIVMVLAGYHPHRYKACEGLTGTEEEECMKEGPLDPSDCQPYRYLDPSFSIVSEFDLNDCSSSWLSAEVASSSFFLGCLIGVWFFGWLSDRCGRRCALISSSSLLQVGGLAACLSPSISSYCLLRGLVGIGAGGQSIAGFVLATELVSGHHRQLVTLWGSLSFLLSAVFTCVSVTVMAPVNWRLLSFVAAAPSLLLLAMWFTKYNIESPRWYASKGKLTQAQAVWQLIATVNRRSSSLPPLERSTTAEAAGEGLVDVITTRPFRMWLAVMLSMWFACSSLYYGGSLYLGKDAEHFSGVTDTEGIRLLAVTTIWCFVYEALVTVCSLAVVDRLGRKAITAGGLLFSSLVAVASYVAYCWPVVKALSQYLALAARVACSSSFTVLYLYTAELFPTSVRGVSTAVCSVGARFAGILVPLFVKLDDTWPTSPLLLFGIIGAASGLAGMLLPETSNRPLQSTLSEGRAFCLVSKSSRLGYHLADVVGRPADEDGSDEFDSSLKRTPDTAGWETSDEEES